MAQQIDIVANLLMKVDGAEAGINKLKNSLSKLKMPEGLENSFKKSFANLDTIFAKYRSQVEKGFDTKGDVSAFTKTSKQLDAELNRLSKHFTELTGKPIDFKIKSENLINAEKELARLVEQKNKLTTDTKGIQLKFEGKEAVRDVETLMKTIEKAAGNTKAGNFIGGALIDLDNGNISQTITQLEQAAVAAQKLGDKKKAAFESENGTSMVAAIQKIVEELRKAEGEFSKTDTAIDGVKSDIDSIQAERMQKVGQYAEDAANSFEKERSTLSQLNGEFQEYARSSQSMSQQLGDLQQSTQYFFSLRNMLNLLKRGVDQAIDTVKELDAAMTKTAVVTDFSVGDMWTKLPEYTANANALGASVKDMYEATTLYYQQGLNTDQAMGIAAETMKMARIGGLEAADATDKMTAALRGFNMELNETSAQRVNDVYSNLAAKTASNTEELGTAMQRTASIAASAGMSFEGTAAFLAQAIETTREPAENLGTAMKTIVARFTELKKNPLEMTEVDGEEVDYNKVDTALKSIGVSLKDANGQFRNLDQVFLDISQRWDSLSQTQQRYVATQAAGSRQQSRFIAMMSNYDRTVQLMDYANNSAGASNEQFGKTMDSLESKLNKLHNAWQQFTMGIANNGMIKFAVGGITTLVGGVNSLIDTLSLGSGTLKSFLSLFTAFTGLKASGKVINSLIGGLGGLVDPTSSFGAGFGRGMTGNRQAVNAAQAAAIYQPIVKAIYDTSQNEIQNENTKGKTGAYDQYNAFKKANQDIRSLTSKQYTSKGLINELSQYDKTTQRNLMRGLAGTELATTQHLMNRYRAGGVEVFKGIGQTKSELRGRRNAGHISDADFFNALYDPRELLKHVDSSNGPGAAAKAYLEKISNEIQSQAENSAIQNHISNLLEEGISQVDIDAFKQSDEFKKATEVERQRILSQGDQGRENKGATKVLDKIGATGAGVNQFGMAIQGFSSLLMNSANPAIQTFGSLLNSVGTGISSLGMGISGLTSAFTAISGSNFITGITGAGTALGGLGITANMLTGGLMLLVGVIAGVAFAIKKHRDNIRKEAEEVTNNYKENNDKHQSNISNLESYKEDFARLSAGVDANGMNINLDTADYERYLEITKAIADINPEIVDAYNAQGNAIINNKNALEETLAIEKSRQAEAFDTYTSDESTKALVAARNLSRRTKEGTGTATSGGSGRGTRAKEHGRANKESRVTQSEAELGSSREVEFVPQTKMRKEAKKVGENLRKGIAEGWVNEKDLIDFGIDINDLATGQEESVQAFMQNYDKVKSRISDRMDSAGDDLKDATKESMLNAFSGYGEASDELDELITPLYEQQLARVGKDLQVPDEFKSYFNKGIKDIVSDANVTDVEGEVDKLANAFKDLSSEGSEYSQILKDVETAQDKYADTLNKGAYETAAEDAKNRIEALKDSLAASGMDLTQGYGAAISQFLDNEIDKIENFTEAGAANLQQALNTMTSEIEAAEGALENFNAIAEGSTYGKAASNMSQIYETATADEHAFGEGDQAFWAGAEALVGRKNLLEGKGGANRDKALKQMQEVQEMLKGGQEGWDNFKIKWFDSADAGMFDKIAGLKLDDSGWIKEIDEKLNPEVYDEIADKLNMSKESLVAMLNLGRQFGEINFTNVGEVRKALATSENTIKNSTNGKVFVRRESLESEMTSQGIDLNKQQEIERDLQKNYNTELIKSADDISKTNNQFAEMGITSMKSLVKTFDDTGQFTKDEIQEYAEKYAKINDENFDPSKFDEYWQQNQDDKEYGGIPTSLDSIQSILSSIESILASQRLSEGYLDNATADDSKKWLFGGEGEDTNAQKFWKGHGSGENGTIKTSEFENTKKELTDFISTSDEYIKKLKEAESAAKERGDYDEAKEIENERKDYEYMKDRAQTYLDEGTEAYNNQIQSKLDAIQKDKEVIDAGLNDIFGQITPEQINTDAAQSTLNQLYNAAINNAPIVLTDNLKTQMEGLGIDIQKAIDAGLIVDKNGVLTAAEQAGKETAEAGVEGNASGQQSVDTNPAKAAGEKKGKETGEAGVSGNASGQSSVPHQAAPGMPSNVPANTVPTSTTTEVKVESEVDESGLENAKTLITEVQTLAGQGATFAISTTGGESLKTAANSAKTLTNSVGDKSVSVNAQVTGTVAVTTLKTTIDNLKGKSVTVNVAHTGLTAAGINSIGTAISNLKDKTVTVKINREGSEPPHTGGFITSAGVIYRAKGGMAEHPGYPKKGTDRIPAYLTPGEYVQNRKAVQYFGIDFMRKINHQDLAGALQSFGSAAKGKYGRLGPNGGGGLTLTGEKGYEVAWIPSENRSMILGANGPQMIDLPSDTIIWDHNKSKKIVNQNAIPAGSHYVTSKGATDPRKTAGYVGSSVGKKLTDTAKKTGDKVSKTAEDTSKAVNRILVWWDNAGRRADAIQRRADKNQKAYEKYLKEMQATLKTTGTIGKGNDFIANTQKAITEYQRQFNKATAELNALDTGSAAKSNKGRKNQYAAGADNIVEVSYKKGKKTKTAYMNTASYIRYDSASGSYQIDEAALKSIKNVDQRKAFYEAAKKELDDRISKKNTAEDAIEKAQEALEKFGEELYNTFFKWENELTRIWNLTKKIEATENNISRIKSYEETLNKQISTGLAKSNDTNRVAQTMDVFRHGLAESTDKIRTQVNLIDEQKKALQKALSVEDERTTLASIQAKLNQRYALDSITNQASNTLSTARANLSSAQQRAANKQSQIASLKAQKKKAKKTSKKNKIQKQINAAQNELNNINSTINYYAQQVNNATAAYNQAVANASNYLNDTEKLGYEEYAKNLQEQIEAQTAAQKYLSVRAKGDGTVEVTFDTEAFEADKLQGLFTEERGKAIQDYVKKIEETSGELSDAYKNANDSVNELYDQLEQLENDWAEYANELWDIHDKEVKTQTDNFKKLSDSINKALKELLDEVKRKLDDRRKQEDNANTERDISQKQQRLAALRADTAGGHQVEIAQLEKEIAEAQQNYQRSLEDQLLDKLQQQADLASQQRERQIELQEAIADGVNNAAMVDLWMSNPDAYRDEIYEAFKLANDYDKKPQALQDQLERKFNDLMIGLTTNQKKQEDVVTAIGDIQDVIDKIAESLMLMTTDITNAKSNGLSVTQAQDLLGASYSDLRTQGGYDIEDFAKSEVSYEQARQAFSAEELKGNKYYAEDAQNEIVGIAKSNLDKAWNAYYYSNKNTVDAFTQARIKAEELGVDTSGYDVEAKIQQQKDAEEMERRRQAEADTATRQANANAYNNAIAAAHKKKSVTKDSLRDAIAKGAAYGVGKTAYQVAYDLAVGDGKKGVTWKEVMTQLKALGYSGKTVKSWNSGAKSDSAFYKAFVSIYGKWSKFATGGLASYTGPAWLDGTPSKPELVLNAADTKNFLALRDILSSAMKSTSAVTNSYGGDIMYDINIHVDKIEKDYDVDRVVDKVKKEITKGAGYRNVTQVRNFK